MRKLLFALIATCNFLFLPVLSKSSLPNSNEVRPPVSIERLTNLKVKDIQKLIGRKLTLKERISFFLLKKTARFKDHKGNLGKTALIFAIAGLVTVLLSFVVPPLGFLGIACCIAAIAMGATARKKNPGDTNANIAFWMGLITLIVYVALILVALALYASGSFF